MYKGRRAFLRGQRLHSIATLPYRPPWAANETLFTRACARCGACVEACPTGLLAQGEGGFPEADFRRGRCTFCADCANACAENARQNASPQPPALNFSPDIQPWTLQAMIGTACLPRQGVLCRSCADHCEEGAIRFALRQGRPAQPEITQSRCTGCGECVAPCPAHAITMQTFPLSNSHSTVCLK
ncbi:MAG: ferredoxin-type protein NapF [Betaproteobacteria bacterium]|nr:ferredoxin-type protein NapF [Betaproteobacteria bacterium]